MSRDATPLDVIEGRAKWCVVCADSRDVLPTLPRVDAVVTDPPYGVNLGKHSGAKESRPGHLVVAGYASTDDTPENLRENVVPAVVSSIEISKRAAVFCADRNAWLYPQPSAIGVVFLPSGCGRSAWGFQGMAFCLFYGKAPDMHLGCSSTVVSSTETAESIDHPCPKPIGWMVWLVGKASRSGEVVLDPFCGSGTTGVACLRLGRRFIGIEKDAQYAEVARERLEAESRGLTLRDARAGQLSLLGDNP